MNLERKALCVGAIIWIGSMALFVSVALFVSSQFLIKQEVPINGQLKLSDEKSKVQKTRKITIAKVDKSTASPVSSKTVNVIKKQTKSAIDEGTQKTSSWIVQVSSYQRKDYAQKLIKILKAKNYKTRLFEQKRQNKTIYAVRLEPHLEDKQQAQKLAQQIQHEFNVIPIIINTN